MAFELTDFFRSYVPRGEIRGLFNVARSDESNLGERYYAYMNEAGSYIIQRVTTSGTTKIYKYYAKAKAPAQLDTDWTGKDALEYVDYYLLFNQND